MRPDISCSHNSSITADRWGPPLLTCSPFEVVRRQQPVASNPCMPPPSSEATTTMVATLFAPESHGIPLADGEAMYRPGQKLSNRMMPVKYFSQRRH
ncbi:hypothetical protein BD311DRAFT_192461 [Dichomitus squalens]|uniref:Uncharacterized protein n=1 Tax=Dichomitus squalens TaxID=114155 RepID=A0A4Q9M4G8_9APHY|nr:hypothetical protein BD311DRAFT_192461 [Dichomitus squalens]